MSVKQQRCGINTSFPGSLIFSFPGAREGGGKMRDPGNEVGVLNTALSCFIMRLSIVHKNPFFLKKGFSPTFILKYRHIKGNSNL